ncbi:MAG: helix-turn-helix transcriptional regulator [Lachnospiraceae bacterium]|nr:helix-turn-helix transcriptional regulator [Lachnospiraceae bacterium]
MYSDENFRDSDSLFLSFEPTAASHIFPLYLTSAGYTADPDHIRENAGSETGVVFIYTVAGEGILRQKNKSVSLPNGFCCLIDCREKYSYEVLAPKKSWRYHYLCFDGNGLSSYAPYLLQKPNPLRPLQPERILEICRIFLQELPQKTPLPVSGICLLLQELLNALLEAVLNTAPEQNRPCGEQGLLSPAFAYICKNYARPISVEELAQTCHLSKYYFLHLFKESCGETPYQYLSRYRIDVARRLLADKSIPLHSIAAMVGYPTYANFLTQFKKYQNTPPENSAGTVTIKLFMFCPNTKIR